MKLLTLIFSFLMALSVSARDPGTGSNTTVGPGPATPDAGSSDTSVMGGGTPGNQGINTLDMKEPNQKRLNKMKEKQEARPKVQDNTDQNPELDTL